MFRVEQVAVSRGNPFGAVDGDLLTAADDQVLRTGSNGTVKWTSEARGQWLVASGSDVAFVVGGKDQDYKTPVTVVDLATGKITSVARPDWMLGHWYRAGDALIRISSTSIARIDPATGQARWSVDGTFNEYMVAATRDTVWVGCPDGACALAADSGTTLAVVHSPLWQPTPDGKTIVYVRGDSIVFADAKPLADRRSERPPAGFTVTTLVSSDSWIAALAQKADEHLLSAYRRSDGAIAWQRSSSSSASLQYIAAGDSFIVYFDSKDASVHVTHLPDGADVIVQHFTETAVVGPDAHGRAPAVPDGPPVVSGDVILVTNLGKTSAYRVVHQ